MLREWRDGLYVLARWSPLSPFSPLARLLLQFRLRARFSFPAKGTNLLKKLKESLSKAG